VAGTRSDRGVSRLAKPDRDLRRFGSFLVVGSIGFVVDATILSVLVHGWGWSAYGARLVSFAAAVSVTWYCNRTWVFTRTPDRIREYGAYFAVQLVGAAINLGTYALIIEVIPSLARVPVVPLTVGAALALSFNYAAVSRWAFGRSTGESQRPQ
jgi:putative flippase GtrA